MPHMSRHDVGLSRVISYYVLRADPTRILNLGRFDVWVARLVTHNVRGVFWLHINVIDPPCSVRELTLEDARDVTVAVVVDILGDRGKFRTVEVQALDIIELKLDETEPKIIKTSVVLPKLV
jgi:hypothetical protein